MCDVVLLVNGNTYPCHRAILAAACPYFNAMFTSVMRESRESQITLFHEPTSTNAFEHLLMYLYSGKLEYRFDQAELFSLVHLADQYQLESLLALGAAALLSVNRSIIYYLKTYFMENKHPI